MRFNLELVVDNKEALKFSDVIDNLSIDDLFLDNFYYDQEANTYFLDLSVHPTKFSFSIPVQGFLLKSIDTSK